MEEKMGRTTWLKEDQVKEKMGRTTWLMEDQVEEKMGRTTWLKVIKWRRKWVGRRQ